MNEQAPNQSMEKQVELPQWLRTSVPSTDVEDVKDLFLANVSHELRTPLNGIIGSVRLLQMMPHDADQEELLDSISESARRMIHLVENVLLHTRIDAGRQEAATERFAPATFLTDLLEAHRRRLSDTGRVSFRVEVDEEVPSWVEGDRENLGLLLDQLIDNAIRHTPHGEIALKVALAKAPAASGHTIGGAAGIHRADAEPVGKPEEGAPGSDGRVSLQKRTMLQIRVEDTGTGIDPAVVPELFTAFRLEDDSYTRRYQGAGLGLVICRKLAQLMGGFVAVDSTPGKGSCFTVHMPIDPEFSHSQVAAAREVLVVEDDLTSRTLMGMFCELFDLRATLAASAHEGWDAYRNKMFSLILTDIQMPVMSGLDLLARIREAERDAGRRSIVIAVTAYALDGDRERMLQAGFDDYLEKPVDLNMFEQMIRRWLTEREGP